jgi:hypothetical protein
MFYLGHHCTRGRERAYAATIVPKVMDAPARQTKRRFNTSQFTKTVLDALAYNACSKSRGRELAWCHVSWTWYESSVVKAAPSCVQNS